MSSGLRPPLTGIRISCGAWATELAAGESGKPVLFIKGEEHSSSPLFMFHPKNFYFVDQALFRSEHDFASSLLHTLGSAAYTWPVT